MKEQVLELERAGGVTTLWLNRPRKRNALNGALVDALSEALRELVPEEETRVVLIRGRGRDFCAGADLEELAQITEEGSEASLADALRLGGLFMLMRRFPMPIVAAVHGRALAGGCGLATACDLILAHEEAELGYPEVHLGFVPAMVMAILRRKLKEGQAFELVTMGKRIPAGEAEGMGLVNRVFTAASFDEEVEAFTRELSTRPPSALALIKGLLYELDPLGFDEGIERGAVVNVEARETEVCREEVRSFLARKGGGRRAMRLCIK
ncbi:enoyl-CoA hydratase/isomerase family protein [Gemmatimonadota bacterium]